MGGAGEVGALAGPGTRVVHAPGGLVVPGFQDAPRPPAASPAATGCGCGSTTWTGRQAYLDADRRLRARAPGRGVDRRRRLGDGVLPRRHPAQGGPGRRRAGPAGLPVQPRRPRRLGQLARAGTGGHRPATTPDPPDGRIERDPATGEPTGTLHEGAAYRVDDQRGARRRRRADWEAAILDAQAHLHSPRHHRLAGRLGHARTPSAAYEALAGDGRLTARVVGALWWDRHRGIEQIADLLDRREQGAVRAPKRGLGVGFHPTTVKIMVDGVLENFTGALLEPYCDGLRRPRRQPRPDLRRPDELLRRPSPSWTGTASRCTCTRSATAPCAARLDAVEAARAANGPARPPPPHRPPAGRPARGRRAASPSSTWSPTARPTGPRPSRRWTS